MRWSTIGDQVLLPSHFNIITWKIVVLDILLRIFHMIRFWFRHKWNEHFLGISQRVLKLGLDWDTNEMSILMFAKLAKPLIGTVGIVINSLHIKVDVCKSNVHILNFEEANLEKKKTCGYLIFTSGAMNYWTDFHALIKNMVWCFIFLLLRFIFILQLLFTPILDGKALLYSFVSWMAWCFFLAGVFLLHLI